jgi:hypothetical protein
VKVAAMQNIEVPFPPVAIRRSSKPMILKVYWSKRQTVFGKEFSPVREVTTLG